MNSATDTDSTTDTRLKYNFERSCKNTIKSESWQENEKKRLSNILEYNLENWDINDKGLQSITKLAAIICGKPLSFITLVGEEYVNFLSRSGSELLGTIRKNSFCQVAIEQEDFFEIEDILSDPRFVENELVLEEPPLRFYAAYPIVSPKGYHFGSLCVCDLKANKLNEIQKEALKTLTDEVMVHLELHKQNKELKEANERAEKLAKVKDEFVNNVSHELRTPLNAIGGYAEILAKTDLDTDQKEAVCIIKGSCEILITLINDILDFSKIQMGKLRLENIPLDLRKTIKNVKDLLNPKAKEKNLKFDLKIDEKIPKFILGDKVRINQIIMNLTGNALKFTQEGSVKIDIKLLNETEKNLEIKFCVKDSGIGIPEDKLQTIFERFEQAGKDITRKFGGSGLGLNISRNLVELHNSKLELKSEVGNGSEFFFTIKFDKLLDEDDSKQVVNKKVCNNYMERISNIKHLRLLVCEDNSVNIKLIKAIFKNKNINIEIAENGKIAIELLKRINKKFDLILMDIQMPEMNGFETTKYIRNIMNLNIPIIGFSASTSEIERNYCFEIGMNDYILKSFGGNEIFDKLDNFVNTNKIYEEDLNGNDNINSSVVNTSIRGLSENNINHTHKKSSNLLKINKTLKNRFDSNLKNKAKANFNNKNKNINNINQESGGLRSKAPIKEKNYSNCEKMGKYDLQQNSPLTSNNSNKNSIGKMLDSNRASQDSHQNSIFSQEIPQLNKFNINFSSDVLNATSSKNSFENLDKEKFSSNKKKISSENSKENEECTDKINALDDGYNSNTDWVFKRRNNNLSFSKTDNKRISQKLLKMKDSDQSPKLNFNEHVNFNRSFNSEQNTDKYNVFLKKCMSVGLKNSEKLNSANNANNNINNNNRDINNYKFSKFNENLNTNKASSQNNSKCFSDQNNAENNLNFFGGDSLNSNFDNILLCEEKIEKNHEYSEKNLEDLKFFENENNFEIISNSSKTPPKIRQSISNAKEDCDTNNEKETQEKNEKESSTENILKNNFSRKSSFSKLKENDSLEFSQVSIKFENFDDHSENENENEDLIVDLENENKNKAADYFEDDPEMRNELLELFMEENPKQMKSLKSAIIARNLDAIKFVAHTMKPSVLMFGLRKMYKKLEKIEIICKSISLNKIKCLYEDIKKDFDLFCEENKIANKIEIKS